MSNTFDFEGLEVEWEVEELDDGIYFEVYTACGRQITDDLSERLQDRILALCWDEYWRQQP